jgi:hypothetical protein
MPNTISVSVTPGSFAAFAGKALSARALIAIPAVTVVARPNTRRVRDARIFTAFTHFFLSCVAWVRGRTSDS